MPKKQKKRSASATSPQLISQSPPKQEKTSIWSISRLIEIAKNEQVLLSQIWCLFGLSIIGYQLTMINAANQISDSDFGIVSKITFYATTLQAILALILYVSIRHTTKEILFKGMIAICVVTNFYSFHVVFLKDFSLFSYWLQLTLILLSVFVTYQFLSSLGEFQLWRIGINSSLAIAVGILSFNLYQYTEGKPIEVPNDGKKITAPQIQTVEFEQKPNIYLLSFDALSAPNVIRSIMQINQIGFQQLLDEQGFRWFKNSFSDAMGTSDSLNRLLALHPRYYDNLVEQNLQKSLYVGVRPSPVFQIFQNNGYLTSTYSRDNYFGKDTGPYTDYQVGYPFALCHNHLPETAVKYGFFGYCQTFSKEWFIHFFISEKNINESIRNFYTDINIYIDFILEDWRKKRELGRPLLMLSYVISPVHIPPGYKGTSSHFKQYRQHYAHLINQQTPMVMQRLIRDIKQNDPNAIIFIFGDHGTGITHPLLEKTDGFVTVNQSIKNLSIWSQKGVASAIYPSDICAEDLSQQSGNIMEKYALNSVIIRQIIKCLGGGKDPIIGKVDYRIYSPKELKVNYPPQNPGRFEDYLYEFPNRMTNVLIPVLAE